MKNDQNPATAHHTITTARRPDNIRSSILVRGRSIRSMAHSGRQPWRQLPRKDSHFRHFGGYFPGVVKWIKYTFCTGRVYFYHCLETRGLRKLVSILNLAWPLTSLAFGAFEPFGLIGKMGSPATTGPKDGFCSGKITPSERC